MKKLTVMKDAVLAYELAHRLERAGIRATVTNEHEAASLYLGTVPNLVVWIDDQSDEVQAVELMRQLLSEQLSRTCNQCGYNLQGHAGAATCPECGFSVTAPSSDRECPQCHEIVPGDFDVCWNCGQDIVSHTDS